MIEVPGHQLVRVLRIVDGRSVFQTRRDGVEAVTRVLTRVKLPAQFARSVREAALGGRGSFASLGDEIAMTLDGYATAARLLESPGNPPRWTSVLDAGLTEAGFVFITTAWVEGTPLHHVERTLDPAEQAMIVRGLLSILCDLHARRVAYGDLKLANVVLRADGGVTLIDLDTLREVPGLDAGAPTRDRSEAWAAPEQILQQETWLASDIFAFARVANEVYRKQLPASWATALIACRLPNPRNRPTAASLLAMLEGRTTWLIDHAGSEIPAEISPESAIPYDRPVASVHPQGDQTEREMPATGEQTEREMPPAGEQTEREPNVQRPPVSSGYSSHSPSSPPTSRPDSVTTASSAASGCFGIVSAVGQFAFFGALFTFAAVGLGFFAYSLAQQNAADAAAEDVLARIKIHKTDPARNTDAEQEKVAKAAASAWEQAHTRRSCAVRAITTVWKQHWHYDAEWSPTDFAVAKPAVEDPLCASEPEAMLARATLYAGACKRRDPTMPTVEDCALAIRAVGQFWSAVPAGESFHWMRVEAAWQELRARNALAVRLLETGNAEAAGQIKASLSRCDAAVTDWLAFAPVNGVYLVRQCAVAAGLGYDVAGYVRYSSLRTATLPTDTTDRRRILTQLYTYAGPECAETTLTWKKSGLQVDGPPWCRAMGDLVRGCRDNSSVIIAENALGDNVHPWTELASALANPAARCVE